MNLDNLSLSLRKQFHVILMMVDYLQEKNMMNSIIYDVRGWLGKKKPFKPLGSKLYYKFKTIL